MFVKKEYPKRQNICDHFILLPNSMFYLQSQQWWTCILGFATKGLQLSLLDSLYSCFDFVKFHLLYVINL